jgi:hypothetical protein
MIEILDYGYKDKHNILERVALLVIFEATLGPVVSVRPRFEPFSNRLMLLLMLR